MGRRERDDNIISFLLPLNSPERIIIMDVIMKRVLKFSIFVCLSLLMVCCKKDPVIQVDEVKEVDFLNKTGDVLEGHLVGEVMGARSIVVFDTLLFVISDNPNGMLRIYSTNDINNKLGSFCKQGRAQNEMARLMYCQTYKKDDHIYMYVIDGGMRICELDITATLEKGATVVTRTKMRPFVELGQDLFLDDDIDYMLDFNSAYNIELEEEQKMAPCKYTLFKGEKQKDLVFFKKAMDVDDQRLVNYPYRGSIKKHPTRNLVVNRFSYMDYLLFMDFDNNHFFAVHQEGAKTHADTFNHNLTNGWNLTFNANTATEDYFMVTYQNGDYSRIEREDGTHYPELLIFDWEGNYIKGLKMDRFCNGLGFDEKKKILYTLSTISEQIYCYDLSSYLP